MVAPFIVEAERGDALRALSDSCLEQLEVKSGEEMRLYFNANKDPQVACHMVEQAADRIAVFVKEQRPSEPNR